MGATSEHSQAFCVTLTRTFQVTLGTLQIPTEDNYTRNMTVSHRLLVKQLHDLYM